MGSWQPSLRSGLPLGFHLNNQLTQALTSRYRDSRLRVDFERFVSCMAQLTCIFREGHPGTGGGEGGCLPWQRNWGGRCLSLLLFSACTGHCSQHLDEGEGVICLTRSQVSLGCRERVVQGGKSRSPRRAPIPACLSSLTQWLEVATFS